MLAKRLFDVAVAALGLLVLAPVFVLLALWIKFDSTGPVFYRQLRVGRNGKGFRIFKFRTMAVASEGQRQLTVGADPRITQCGSHLRQWKLDELPQLINVLAGDMSLVGPRPEVPRYVALYPDTVRAIVLSVAPGVTDWASIEFRSESAILGSAVDPERAYVDQILPVKLDYYVRYVHQRSFWMDLRILFATLGAILFRGAN